MHNRTHIRYLWGQRKGDKQTTVDRIIWAQALMILVLFLLKCYLEIYEVLFFTDAHVCVSLYTAILLSDIFNCLR